MNSRKQKHLIRKATKIKSEKCLCFPSRCPYLEIFVKFKVVDNSNSFQTE